MKIRELHQKSYQELQKLLEERRAKLVDVRFRVHSGRVKNIHELRVIRKEIAQIATLLRA